MTPSQATHDAISNLATSRWTDLKALDLSHLSTLLPELCVDELVLGIHHVELHDSKEDAWLVLTTHNCWLLVDEGRSLPSMKELHHTTLSKQNNRISRDTINLRDEPLILIPKLFSKVERELLDLALLSPELRTFQAAKILFHEELHTEASTLLHTAKSLQTHHTDTLPELDDEVVAPAPETQALTHTETTPLTLTDKILIWQAKAAIAMGAQGQAIDHLVELTQNRPNDDLVLSTMELGQDDVRWWLPIALAHEEADDMTSAAHVYQRLYELHPAHDGFLFNQAHCLDRAMHTQEAIELYTQYIEQRIREEQIFPLIMELEEHSSHQEDYLSQACHNLGKLHESQARWLLAMESYLNAIQHRPFNLEHYRLLIRTLPYIKDNNEAHQRICNALTLLNILSTKHYSKLKEDLDSIPSLYHNTMPPEFLQKLTSTQHEELLTHPGENLRSNGAQKWLSGLMIDHESTRDIERHCERLSPTKHDITHRTLTALSNCLNIPTPRVYLSHGMTGIQVFGEDSSSSPALLLMGAAHIDSDHPQHLPEREMAFALGSQLEHIRAGHLVLTSSEFWGAFRDKALSGSIALLSLIPVGSALGKLADGVAAPLVDYLKKGFDNKLFQLLVGYIDKQIKDGAAHGQIQSAYEATIGALILSEKRAHDLNNQPQSLIKEELADFARCALYTADRFGLLACDDLTSAVHAILLLSTHHTELDTIKKEGIIDLLQRTDSQGKFTHAELAMRLSELFSFALSKQFATLRKELIEPQ